MISSMSAVELGNFSNDLQLLAAGIMGVTYAGLSYTLYSRDMNGLLIGAGVGVALTYLYEWKVLPEATKKIFMAPVFLIARF